MISTKINNFLLPSFRSLFISDIHQAISKVITNLDLNIRNNKFRAAYWNEKQKEEEGFRPFSPIRNLLIEMRYTFLKQVFNYTDCKTIICSKPMP